MTSPKLDLDGEKPPVPEVYRASLAGAKRRTLSRLHGPMMELDQEAHTLVCPFAEVEPEWHFMVMDTFGTRGHPIAKVFIQQLAKFCDDSWNEDKQIWQPDEDEITMILHVVAAHRPKNEAEAVLAAQIAATHMILMKVGHQAYKNPWDRKTVGAYARLAQASAVQHDAMARTKGKRATRQTITVRKENHVHYHVHRGEPGSDAQPHGAGEPAQCTAVSGADQGGEVVPIASRRRQAGVSASRG